MNACTYVAPIFALACIAAVISAQGCSSTMYVTYDGRGDSVSYAQFNSEIALEKMHVRTSSTYTRVARYVRVTPDSCVWLDAESGATMHAPLSEMKDVVFIDHFKGFWKGVLYGGLCGMGLGYVVYEAGDWDEPGLAALAVPAVFGTTGLLTGCVVGILTGYENTYVIQPYGGGATVIYMLDGSRVIGSVEDLVPGKHVVMRTWDGSRMVIDHALIDRMDIPTNE